MVRRAMVGSSSNGSAASSVPSATAARECRGDYCLISPARNEAEHVRSTLDSVLAQTVLPKRWIIIDDGSTDDTPRILAEYSDPLSIRSQQDVGEPPIQAGQLARVGD